MSPPRAELKSQLAQVSADFDGVFRAARGLIVDLEKALEAASLVAAHLVTSPQDADETVWTRMEPLVDSADDVRKLCLRVVEFQRMWAEVSSRV